MSDPFVIRQGTYLEADQIPSGILPLDVAQPGHVIDLVYEPVERRRTILSVQINESADQNGGIVSGVIVYADLIPQHEALIQRYIDPPFEHRQCAIIGACAACADETMPFQLARLGAVMCGQYLMFMLCYQQGRSVRCILPERIVDWRVAV